MMWLDVVAAKRTGQSYSVKETFNNIRWILFAFILKLWL